MSSSWWPSWALRADRAGGTLDAVAPSTGSPWPLGLKAAAGPGALAWVAFKVGALSFGGGFVIVPLIQHDAVTTYHWMSAAHFLTAVALGQVTPGPVVLTVASVGYAAAGLGGALLGAAVAFAPSFAFVLAGARALQRRALEQARRGLPHRGRSVRPRRDRRLGGRRSGWP